MILAIVSVFIFALTFYIVLRLQAGQNHDRKIPPGPWGLPILGHLLFLGALPERTLLEWKKIYGSIMSVRLGSLPVVVLSDAKIIKEAFSLPTIADRPDLELYSRYSGGKKGLFFSGDTSAKEQRQFLVPKMRQFGYGKSSMEESILAQLSIVINKLEADVQSASISGQPLTLSGRFEAGPLNTFWNIVMSQDFDPEHIEQYETTLNAVVTPDGVLSALATFVPSIGRFVPGVQKKIDKKVELWRNMQVIIQKQIDTHAKTRVPGQPRDLTDAYLDKIETTDNSESTFHRSQNFQFYVNNDLAAAALDDVSIPLLWIFLYLIRDEGVQQKVFEEITSVIGNCRSVTLADRPDLPLTDGVVHETLRLSPNAPLNVIHKATKDVTLSNGYFIPKDMAVVSNFHAVHCDPEVWEDPMTFRPERWVVSGEKIFRKELLENWIPFSCGRRSCIGSDFAFANIFLYAANLIQRFKFECCDVNQMPSVVPVPGIVYFPQKYFVRVTDRSQTGA